MSKLWSKISNDMGHLHEDMRNGNLRYESKEVDQAACGSDKLSEEMS